MMAAGPARRRWLQTALAGAGLAVGLGRAGPAHASDDAPAIVWPALTTIDGQALDPRQWQGVPSVVVFWATWCGYCRRHNARIDQLFRSVDPQRLNILGVVIDGDAEAARRYMAAAGYRFPVVLDAGRLRPRFTERRMVPMTCLVDARGRRGLCIPGEMSEDDVLALGRLALQPAR